MGGFDGYQLAEELVVLGVGELRSVVLVVEAVGPIDRRDELGVSGGRRIRGECLGGSDQLCVDGQAVGSFGHRAALAT